MNGPFRFAARIQAKPASYREQAISVATAVTACAAELSRTYNKTQPAFAVRGG